MEVITYQLVIVATIWIAYRIKPSFGLWASIGWSAETVLLLFFPPLFQAQAFPGASDTTGSLLTMTIESTNPLLGIKELLLGEAGDVIMAGFAGAASTGTMSFTGTVTVTHDAGGLLGVPVVIPFVATFTPSATIDGATYPQGTDWQGNTVVDVSGVVPGGSK